MIATTIEQSRRLIELGLSPDSADMEFCYIDEFNSGLQVKGDINTEVDRRLDMMFGVTHIPAWSLSALLEVMPITITKDGMEHKLKVFPSGLFSTHSDTSKWTVQYCGIDYSYRARDKYPILVAVTQYDLIDAAYEMVCWLLENNLITNN